MKKPCKQAIKCDLTPQASEIDLLCASGMAKAIFEGLEKREDDIFPDPMSLTIADGWRGGVAKALERQYAPFVPPRAES